MKKWWQLKVGLLLTRVWYLTLVLRVSLQDYVNDRVDVADMARPTEEGDTPTPGSRRGSADVKKYRPKKKVTLNG